MPKIKPPRSEQQDPLPEVESHEPPAEDIEIELSGADDGEAVVEIAPQPAAAGPAAPEPDGDDDVLKRALERASRAEELQRSAQRERDEAVRRDQERERELAQERGGREEAEYNSVLTAIAAEQSALEKAEADYAAFAAAGEWGSAAKAQRIIGTASARLDRLEDNKTAFDSRREASKTEPTATRQPAPVAGPLDFESKLAAISGLPDPGKEWLRKHPEFVNDPTMNKKIGAAHNYLTDVENIEPFSTAYFDALDTRFGFKAPATPAADPAPQPAKPRSIPMSAPVSRDVPTPSGQRQPSSKITLTAEERQIARTSFTSDMSNEQKELLYARNKQKLARMKANGEYQERTS